MNETDHLKADYFRVTDLWRRLCEAHNQVYKITCKEYDALLSNDIELLNSIVEEKEVYVGHINALEGLRQDIIEDINSRIPSDHRLTTASTLIGFFEAYEKNFSESYLESFNELLLDILQKIKFQNKKNQIFINKAMISLEKLKKEALGLKDVTTYKNDGKTQTSTLPG